MTARPRIPAGCDGDPCSLLHYHAAQEQPHPELADRRQRAQCAGLDALADPAKYSYTVAKAVEAAIETATRVQITPEVLAAARAGYAAAGGSWTEDPGPRETARLIAAFRAAGFEVEE